MNKNLPHLLRAIAGGANAVQSRHDIILNAAADEIERLRAATNDQNDNATKALLRTHRCNSDERQSVGQCVDSGACGCSCGLLLGSADDEETMK